MKRLVLQLILLSVAAGLIQGPAVNGAVKNSRSTRFDNRETIVQRDRRMKWWREARFGMFIHWGLYAVPAGEYKGQRSTRIGEWIMEWANIPRADYEKFAPQFNPVKFDAKEWVSIAKNAGMKYIVITSKHHDGFALYDSKVSDYKKINRLSLEWLVAIVVTLSSLELFAQQPKPKPPRVFLINAQRLAETKKQIQSGDKAFDAALAKLDRDAQKALQQEPVSVVTKATTPPSGDKHDYMSRAPYFWPDPTKPDGLPYIRRDGERNPEINKISDHRTMDEMVAAVRTLTLAYYLRGKEEYAAKAAQLLRAWFLDPATRMNPHLQYAQAIPGVTTGRGIGLIETRGLTNVVDAIGLLAGSKNWTAEDQRGLEVWFGKFLQWMLESKNGRDENAAKNNHGTYYDVQTTSFALFLGKADLARMISEAAKQKRIAAQIERDGRQPLELARTRAWSYSNGNLDGLMLLARLAENAGVDLWNYQAKDGGSIRSALEYLYPFAIGQEKWTYQQLGGFNGESLFPLMRRAAAHYQDNQFKTMMMKVPKGDPTDRNTLAATQ